jgi:predicted small secreted protein
MNTFIIGVLVGIALFALIYAVVMLSKLHAGLILVHQNLDAQSKALQMAFIKINKIEKVTDHTMSAAENFVDVLRESAEQMMTIRPLNLRGQRGSEMEQFDDLRKAFDEGIRQFEEDEEDEEGEEPDNKWKK